MKWIKKIIPVFFLFGFYAHATSEVDMKDLLPNYLAIQEALAKDDLNKTIAEAQTLQEKIKSLQEDSLKNIKTSLAAIENAKNIKTAREEFKKLSVPFVAWVLKNSPENVSALQCSMANAPWVQKSGKTQNPYYGKSMLGCGEKIPPK